MGRPQTGIPAPQAPGPLSIDWGEAAEWQWRGLVVHWRRLGDSSHPPVLLVHGFAAGSGHWRHNGPALAAAGWCVYALDLVGFGASSQPGMLPGRRLDNRLWARQLQAFLEQVVQGPAVLIGHSLGGLVALSCAVYFPAWVRGVVAAPLPDPTLVTAPGGRAVRRLGRRPPWRRRLQHALVQLLCRLLPLELIVPLLAHSPLLALGIQSAYRRPVLDDRALHRLIAVPARRPGAARTLRAMSVGMALRPAGATAPVLLQRLRRPLLLLWGLDDRLVPARVAEQCRAIRPDLPLVRLEEAGHCPHDEQPEAFHAAVLPWLAGLAETPGPAQGVGA